MSFNKCCIKNCTNRRKDARLHKFPCDDIRRSKWLEIIGCDELNSLDLWSISRKLVCHEHFETRFYTEKQWLYSTAYPTLFSAEEIASGVPSKSYGKEFPATDLDHCYSKRKHWDHSYVKSGPCVPDNLTKKRRKVETEPACQKTQAPSKSQKKICDNLNETKSEGSEADDDFYTMDQDYIEDDFEVAINLNDEDKKNLEDEDVKYVREIVFEKDLTHPDYKCNVCSSEIVGFRYVCVQCVDWDMCTSCEAIGEHPEHYVLRLPAPKPYVECEPIIAAVREQIKNLTLLNVEIKPEVYLKEENDVDEITEEYDPNLTDPFTTTNDRNVPKLEKYESATEIESFSASGKQFEYFDESGEEIETFSDYGEEVEAFSKSGKEIESFSGSSTKTETLRDLRNSTIIDPQSTKSTKSGGKKITVRVNAYSNSVNQCLEEIFKSVRNPNIDNKEPECSNSSPS